MLRRGFILVHVLLGLVFFAQQAFAQFDLLGRGLPQVFLVKVGDSSLLDWTAVDIETGEHVSLGSFGQAGDIPAPGFWTTKEVAERGVLRFYPAGRLVLSSDRAEASIDVSSSDGLKDGSKVFLNYDFSGEGLSDVAFAWTPSNGQTEWQVWRNPFLAGGKHIRFRQQGGAEGKTVINRRLSSVFGRFESFSSKSRLVKLKWCRIGCRFEREIRLSLPYDAEMFQGRPISVNNEFAWLLSTRDRVAIFSRRGKFKRFLSLVGDSPVGEGAFTLVGSVKNTLLGRYGENSVILKIYGTDEQLSGEVKSKFITGAVIPSLEIINVIDGNLESTITPISQPTNPTDTFSPFPTPTVEPLMPTLFPTSIVTEILVPTPTTPATATSTATFSPTSTATVIPDLEPPSVITNLGVGVVAADLSTLPGLTWDPASDDVSGVKNYEVQVLRSTDNGIVLDWTPITSGQPLTGLSLDQYTPIYVKVRAIDYTNKIGPAVSSSESWIPGSNECRGNALNGAIYGGSGSAVDPFLVCTPDQFAAIGGRPSDWGGRFKLGASLDLSGKTLTPIGDGTNSFKGIFEGNGRTLRNISMATNANISFGVFGRVDGAWIRNMTFLNSSITASSASGVGGIAGYCNRSQLTNIVASITVEGGSYVGTLLGIASQCRVVKAELSGTVTGHSYGVGGAVGALYNSHLFNVASQVTVNAASASSVGGLIGEEGWAQAVIQNCVVTGSVVGGSEVGGLAGFESDGLSVYRSQFSGTVDGNTNVGGLVGSCVDSPFSMVHNLVTGTVTGNQNVGGLVGGNEYWFSVEDTAIRPMIVGKGSTQRSFGGMVGESWDGFQVDRTYVNTVVSSGAQRVGGLVGYQVDWNSSGDYINNTALLSTVTGNSADNSVSLFGGSLLAGPLSGTGSVYWSSASCDNQGPGDCNNTGNPFQAVALLSNIYSKTNTPLSSWDFVKTWVEQPNDMPTLNFSQTGTPSLVENCPRLALKNKQYSCTITPQDSDINELHTVIFEEDHTCGWLPPNISGSDLLLSVTTPSTATSCRVSFRITDGTNTSPPYAYELAAEPGVTPSGSYLSASFPSASFSSYGTKNITVTFTNNESQPISGFNIAFDTIQSEFNFQSNTAFPGQGGTCTASLNPGQSCTATFRFTPASSGSKSTNTTVSYTTTAGARSYSFLLTGFSF